jgi:hypothetical protein
VYFVVGHQRFGGLSCLHLQGEVNGVRNVGIVRSPQYKLGKDRDIIGRRGAMWCTGPARDRRVRRGTDRSVMSPILTDRECNSMAVCKVARWFTGPAAYR